MTLRYALAGFDERPTLQQQTLTFSFDGLAAGASASREFNCNALLRSRTATVDADAQVAEANESNNAQSGVFGCPA